MSMTGYDDNIKLPKPLVLTEVEKEQQAKALEDYRAQSDIILKDIESAKLQLEDLNNQIKERQTFYDGIFEDKVKNMSSQISQLEEEFNKKQVDFQKLENEIAVKLTQSEAIKLDFSNQQKEMDDQKESQRLFDIKLQGIQNRLEAREITLQQERDQLETNKGVFDQECEKRNNALAVKELELSNRQVAFLAQQTDLDNRDILLRNAEVDLKAKQDKLTEDLTAAQLILNQATAIMNQKAVNETRAVELDTQEAQLAVDINQIKATQIAIDIQKAELKQRQLVIETTEKKIATGG